MMTEPPHWLSWFSDIGSILGLLALIGVPVYKGLLPKVRNWQAKKSHSRRKKKLADLQRELIHIERLAKHPEIATLIILRYILFALFFIVLPDAVEGYTETFFQAIFSIHLKTTLPSGVPILRLFAWSCFFSFIWDAWRQVDYAIEPSVYKQRILDSIKEFQELDEQQNSDEPRTL